LCFVSCQSDRIRQELLAVETYLNAEPERALRVLDSMDVEDLHRRRDRAHYALLKSMALDKNYIDLTSDSLIAPAVEYYSKYGTPDEKMKAYYYQGVVFFNARHLPEALLSLYQAKQCMESSEDARLKGIIYMTLSDLYELLYDSPMVKEYLDKGIEQFLIAQDTTQYRIALLQKAVYCQSENEVTVADSLYRNLLGEIETLPPYSAQMLLTNYAKFCIINPVPNAQETIKLYNKLFNEYGYRLHVSHAGPLAYAHELVGDSSTANYIFQRFENGANHPLAYWKYLFEKSRGNMDKALTELEHVNQAQSRLFQRKMSVGEEQLLLQYLEKKNAVEQREKFILVLLLLSLLVVSVAIYRHLLYRKRIQQESYENMLSTLRYANSRMESTQNELEDKFVHLYREKFKVVNDLYFLYSQSGMETSLHHELMMQKITGLFSGIEEEGRLATILDQDLDNLIRDMRSEVDLTDQEVLLICFFVIKLDTRIISCITNLSTASIYTRKSRIIKKIESLSSSSKSKYLRYLR
jgi:hypothetical protein